MTDHKQDFVGYAMRYGGMCRDCADECGVCPHSGMPCKSEQCRAVMSHALQAWRYGVARGYIDNPVPDEALRTRAESLEAELEAARKRIAELEAALDHAKTCSDCMGNFVNIRRKAFNAGWNLAGGDHRQDETYLRWVGPDNSTLALEENRT